MSSDTSRLTVLSIAERAIELRVRSLEVEPQQRFAGFTTRSFALVVLGEAREKARWDGFPEPARVPALAREREQWEDDWYISADFMRSNVGTYIERTEVISVSCPLASRKGEVSALQTELFDYEAELRESLPPADAEARCCERFNHVVLRVVMTSPRWLEGLVAGLVWGSTAYDVWDDDPSSDHPR